MPCYPGGQFGPYKKELEMLSPIIAAFIEISKMLGYNPRIDIVPEGGTYEICIPIGCNHEFLFKIADALENEETSFCAWPNTNGNNTHTSCLHFSLTADETVYAVNELGLKLVNS